ncbi:hypothetical protein SFRURICE_015531 [Spodoptera frugiperda]|nr:hypothetical protein SFRURICE_015531 [Spodoptera frugiperda]
MVLAKGLRPLQVVSVILFVRLLSVFLVQTWYVPDEYWQTLEVAHKQVFGYGALTWEWQQGIRSYLYPSVVAGLYTLLKYTGLDYPEALILLPRILQAIISTAADYSFYKWTGNRKWALFLILTSWFWFYTSGRTLLQTLETSLVAIALSEFPFKGGKLGHYEQESPKWIWLAVLCVFLRPTSAPLWAVLGAYNLLTTNQSRLKLIVRTYVPIALVCGGALVALDSYYYGRLIVTPWEFFRFNVLHDIASFYGQHPWHWYLTQGIPAVLGVNVIPVLWATVQILRRPKENKIGSLLLTAVALYVAVYSFIPHKEFRFVLPLLPIFLYLAQDVIVPWSRKAKKLHLYLLAGSILVGNAVPALYFGVVHQAGPCGHARWQGQRTLSSCPATPRLSTDLVTARLVRHLHLNITTRYLSCEPPLNASGTTYEAEAFFNNPQRWWRQETTLRQAPDLLVLYDRLKGRIESILAGYNLLHEIPHTQFPEGEVSENLLIYQKAKTPPKVAADDVV